MNNTESKEPLYKVLKSKITKGKWKQLEQEKNFNEYTVVTDEMTIATFLAIDIEDEEGEANSAFAALAVNNLSEIADNLARIIDRIEESNLQDNFPSAYKRAKKSLLKIS